MLTTVPTTPSAATGLTIFRLLVTPKTIPPLGSASGSADGYGRRSAYGYGSGFGSTPRTGRWIASAGMAVGLTGCFGTTHANLARTSTKPAISGDRFEVDLSFAGGEVTVAPPPAKAQPGFAKREAISEFESANVADGLFDYSVLALGLVTIKAGLPVQVPTTSSDPATTGPTATSTTGPNTSAVGTSTTSLPGTTSSTSALSTTGGSTIAGSTTVGSTTTGSATTGSASPLGSTSTTAAPSSTTASTSSAPTTTANNSSDLPSYESRLAWVGIAWQQPTGSTSCTQGAPSSSDTSTTQVHLVEPATSGNISKTQNLGEPNPRDATDPVIVVMDAETGGDVVAFAGGMPKSQTCPDGTSASITAPKRVTSLAWTPVSNASTAVRVTLPSCAQYYGWTQVAVSGSAAPAIEVIALVPFDPTCSSPAPTPFIVDDVIPLGSVSAPASDHAPIGAIDVLQLPGGMTP